MAAEAFELADDFLYILRAFAVDDHQRVFGVDDDHVLEADQCDQPARLGPDDAALGLNLDDVAADAVADRVLLDQLAEAVPVADVDKLASAMLSFLKRPDLLPAMARASRLKAERRFDERTVNRTLLAAIGLND